MGRNELPEHLTSRPFTVADAAAAGLRGCDLRRRGLHRPTHSVRTTTEPTDLASRAAAFAAALPADSAFSHVTAARLLRLPLPAGLEADDVLDVMRPSTFPGTRRQGCRGHRGLEKRAVVVRHGVRVVAASDTWCDLGELVGGGMATDDLVVTGDAILLTAGRDGVGRLRSVLDSRVRPRGKAALAEALELVRPRVRSPGETRARLMFVRAGFPEPEVNAVVHDGAGGWLLEGDLVWRKQRLIGEYQGAHHSSRFRRSLDAQRGGLARDEGWTLLELFAEDVEPGPRRRSTLVRFAHALDLPLHGLRLD